MWEKHWSVASHIPPTGDLAHNPGMCPDWVLNRRPFGSQASTQSSELHQPGKINTIFKRDRDNRLYFIYLFLERGEGREKEERNIYAWLPPALPLLGTWPGLQLRHMPWPGTEPATLWTRDPLAHRPALNPLSYTSQAEITNFRTTHFQFYFLQKILPQLTPFITKTIYSFPT